MSMYGNTDILAKALDASWLRNETISNNIANVDTPGYKRKDVAFESLLEQALKANGKLDTDAISKLTPKIFEDNSNLNYRMDGNNVDMDTEMAYLVQNQLRYSTLINQVNYNFSNIKTVLNK